MPQKFIDPMQGKSAKKPPDKKPLHQKKRGDSISLDSDSSDKSDKEDLEAGKGKSKDLNKEEEMRKRLQQEKAKVAASTKMVLIGVPVTKKALGKSVLPKPSTLTPEELQAKQVVKIVPGVSPKIIDKKRQQKSKPSQEKKGKKVVKSMVVPTTTTTTTQPTKTKKFSKDVDEEDMDEKDIDEMYITDSGTSIIGGMDMSELKIEEIPVENIQTKVPTKSAAGAKRPPVQFESSGAKLSTSQFPDSGAKASFSQLTDTGGIQSTTQFTASSVTKFSDSGQRTTQQSLPSSIPIDSVTPIPGREGDSSGGAVQSKTEIETDIDPSKKPKVSEQSEDYSFMPKFALYPPLVTNKTPTKPPASTKKGPLPNKSKPNDKLISAVSVDSVTSATEGGQKMNGLTSNTDLEGYQEDRRGTLASTMTTMTVAEDETPPPGVKDGELLDWLNQYNVEEVPEVVNEDDEDDEDEGEGEGKDHDRKNNFDNYEDFLEKTMGLVPTDEDKLIEDAPAPQKDKDGDRASNDSEDAETTKKKWNDPNPKEPSPFTKYNRPLLKWSVIFVALGNFLYSLFTCWQQIMNAALHEYLLSINSINCPVPGNDDWIVVFVNVIWTFASFTLFFAENEQSAQICIFWVVIKLCQVMTFLYVRWVQLLLVTNISEHIFEFCWIILFTILDLISMGIVICQYYRLTNNSPIRRRVYRSRGNAYLNREIWFTGEQEFFQSKHAYRWVCRNQTLKVVEKIEKLRKKYKRPNKNYKFSSQDFDVDFEEGYNEYRKSYNIETDIFNARIKLDFGRFRDDKELKQAVKNDLDDDQAATVVEEE